DPIEVRITLDAPLTSSASVTLHWEAAGEPLEPVAVPMEASARGPAATEVRAVIPPQPSQTLVRSHLEVALAGGGTLFLPHPVEPRAFLSCFVHDLEVESVLPILWLFPKRRTGLPGLDSRTISAGVILEPGSRSPLVFDGADLRSSTQGLKLRFVKGEEYRGDRTINIIPEQGGGGTGSMAPHMEHLGFTVFRDLGALVPRVDWFRVVDMGTAVRLQTQRLIIQQVNERFLEMNGLDENGDLYKLDKSVFQKKTNLHTGIGNLNDLLAALSRGTPESRRAAVLDRLDIESVGLYSTVNILIENWDGFHNNFYVYHDLTPEGRWMIIPWDLDQVFEPVRFDFPVNFPLTGQSTTVSRETGPIARPYHLQPDLHEAYREAMRARIAPGGPFTTEAVNARIDAIEVLLLEDLALLEAGTRSVRAVRRLQVKNAHAAMKTYMEKRIPFLRAALGN
ncbi:MAG TPA: CotH kinase family protein, partial [Planctomycetota bacterium]|nr:CotH kinase family protein [Planctomycetota bacterium]